MHSGSLTVSEALVQWHLSEMKRIHQCFPFGKTISDKILKRFSHLCLAEQGNPTSKHDLRACREAYLTYVDLGGWSLFNWIKNHDLIRLRLMQLLSSREVRYFMEAAELDLWQNSVFHSIKKYVRLNGKTGQRESGKENFENGNQMCVDALSDLIEASEQCADRVRFLVGLCRRTSLLPKSFSQKESNPVKDDTPVLVGIGASAKVWRARSSGGDSVVEKCLDLHAGNDAKTKDATKKFLIEALLLRWLRHPHVLPLISVTYRPTALSICSPWMENGRIIPYLEKNPALPRKEFLEQVADALDFIHKYGVVHGDLKGDNVLINAQGQACIADFGLSSFQLYMAESLPCHNMDPAVETALRQQCLEALEAGGLPRSLAPSLSYTLSSLSTRAGGTPRWTAPEVLFPVGHNRKTSAKSDVYSFGMFSHEVYSLAVPFSEHKDMHAILNVIAGKRPSRPGFIPDEVWSLVQECWVHDPSKRPRIWDAYNRLACMDGVFRSK